jgi:hypothetical protein
MPMLAKPVYPKNKKKVVVADTPATLSGFKGLHSLAVLDIDTLDYISEIKTCIRSSSSTLTKLKLSFSDSLASQARKPPPENDPDDTDPDDEFPGVPLPPSSGGYMDDASGPAKAFRAQEERKSQEAVLGRIFDVEPLLVKKTQDIRIARASDQVKKEEEETTPERTFFNDLKNLSQRLMEAINAGTADITQSQQDILDLIEHAAQKYINSDATESANTKEAKKADSENEITTAVATTSITADPSASSGSTPTSSDTVTEKNVESATSEPSLFQSKPSKNKDTTKDVHPEDIDIEAPVDVDEPEDQTSEPKVMQHKESGKAHSITSPDMTSTANASSSDPTDLASPVSKTLATIAAQKVNLESLVTRLETFEEQADQLTKDIHRMRIDGKTIDANRLLDAEKQLSSFQSDIEAVHNAISGLDLEMKGAGSLALNRRGKTGEEASTQRISEYIRSTRGLALRSLSIHLIPVKASVLSRSIDLRVLKRLTLLNVGGQVPVWTLLAKENKIHPLALRKVFTDNVTMAFLNCISQLEELHELFMLERCPKHKPESFASKTLVSIEQMRRLVLKKHIRTIQKLMIKNDNSSSWDANEKTMHLICSRGVALEELAVSMGIRVVVSFIHVNTIITNFFTYFLLLFFYFIFFSFSSSNVAILKLTQTFPCTARIHAEPSRATKTKGIEHNSLSK